MKKILAIAVLALVSASCAKSVPSNKQSLVLAEDTGGGLCQNGGCFAQTLIYSDGSYKVKNNESNKSGLISLSLVIALQTQIQKTDFRVLSSVPFTDTCPAAYDGSRTVYTFYNPSGQNYKLDSCEVKIDAADPIFKAVGAIEKQIQ